MIIRGVGPVMATARAWIAVLMVKGQVFPGRSGPAHNAWPVPTMSGALSGA